MSSKQSSSANRVGILKSHPEVVLGPNATLRDAMKVMTAARIGVAVVVDKDRRLLGLLTDIDLRRTLLRTNDMTVPVSRAMNRKPITVKSDFTDSQIAVVFRTHPKSHLPVVDHQGRLVGLIELHDFEVIAPHFANTIVIMAGGMGRRLGELTRTTPKPMLPVGDKPILELLIEQFRTSGFSNFVLAVNHLANQIVDYFGDGKALGVKIRYLRERQPLGTVGALSMLKSSAEEPVIVANGDILTKVSFAALLDFHKAEGALATLCVKPHEINVPYGVVELEEDRLHRFVEKPTHRSFINAGIYVLEQKALKWIPKGRRFDMPDLLAAVRKRRPRGVACFPIQEYWLDIGEIQAYQRAREDYSTQF